MCLTLAFTGKVPLNGVDFLEENITHVSFKIVFRYTVNCIYVINKNNS